MEPLHAATLWMPSVLCGPAHSVQRMTRAEGHRSGAHYRKTGFFPAPRQMREVLPGEVVVARGVVDFQRERPAWRLYLVSRVMEGVCEAMEWRNVFQVRDAYEAFCRETAWGALYFAISEIAPKSARCMALRLQAVLRFWEPLQSVRYLFSAPEAPLTLEEVMRASCDWAMEAWCPEGEDSVRARLEVAAERMAQATREDSIEAILREMPRALAHAHELKHLGVLADPAFVRKRLAALEPEDFERVSGACTADLLEQVYIWDRELGSQRGGG